MPQNKSKELYNRACSVTKAAQADQQGATQGKAGSLRPLTQSGAREEAPRGKAVSTQAARPVVGEGERPPTAEGVAPVGERGGEPRPSVRASHRHAASELPVMGAAGRAEGARKRSLTLPELGAARKAAVGSEAAAGAATPPLPRSPPQRNDTPGKNPRRRYAMMEKARQGSMRASGVMSEVKTPGADFVLPRDMLASGGDGMSAWASPPPTRHRVVE
jgi:hypothetical protein